MDEQNLHWKILIIVCVSLVSGSTVFLGNSIIEHQSDTPPQNELILALVEINRPVDFCGTPRLQAIETVKEITGLNYDKVIEMAASYARYFGIPENAYHEERIMNLDDRARILDGDSVDLDGIGRIHDKEGNVRLYELVRKPI